MADDTLAELFARGEQAGEAPETDVEPGQRVRTSKHSPWLKSPCPVCLHTFRRDDSVKMCAGGVVQHAMAALPCSSGGQPAILDGATLEAFHHGLQSGWEVSAERAGFRIVLLGSDHPLAKPVAGGRQRRRCAVCDHTFRAGETVVLCPCGKNSASCLTAMHHDIASGLLCFDDWAPGAVRGEGSGPKICPVDMTEVRADS